MLTGKEILCMLLLQFLCGQFTYFLRSIYVCELTVKPSNKERKEQDFFKSGFVSLGILSGESFTLLYNKGKNRVQVDE